MTTTQEDIGAYLDWLAQHAGTQIKLEITGGTRTWRRLPGVRHQKAIDRIRASIEPLPDHGARSGCGCYHLNDANLKFPDGSFKRPDIAIFCVEPPDIDESWEQVPEAVIEIISPGYEEKDLSINPPWYLSQGVKDVLVFDPPCHALLRRRLHHEPSWVAHRTAAQYHDRLLRSRPYDVHS